MRRRPPRSTRVRSSAASDVYKRQRGIPRPPSRTRRKGDRMTALLALDDVHVYYGPFHALRGNTLTVGEGEIVSLLGGNASGKSTTMKTILGLVKVKSGTIRLAGRDITHASTNHRVLSLIH